MKGFAAVNTVKKYLLLWGSGSKECRFNMNWKKRFSCKCWSKIIAWMRCIRLHVCHAAICIPLYGRRCWAVNGVVAKFQAMFQASFQTAFVGAGKWVVTQCQLIQEQGRKCGYKKRCSWNRKNALGAFYDYIWQAAWGKVLFWERLSIAFPIGTQTHGR